MEFDYYEENPSGSPDYYGNWGHAFVAIECSDGIWFIEPQTDGMWFWRNSTHDHLDVWEVVWHWTCYNKCAFARHQAVYISDTGNPGDIFIQHINRMA
ncbi:hypothetical protein J7L36_02095 [bacterium]|nr:hypothetical protein [bacterium]